MSTASARSTALSVSIVVTRARPTARGSSAEAMRRSTTRTTRFSTCHPSNPASRPSPSASINPTWPKRCVTSSQEIGAHGRPDTRDCATFTNAAIASASASLARRTSTAGATLSSSIPEKAASLATGHIIQVFPRWTKQRWCYEDSGSVTSIDCGGAVLAVHRLTCQHPGLPWRAIRGLPPQIGREPLIDVEHLQKIVDGKPALRD